MDDVLEQYSIDLPLICIEFKVLSTMFSASITTPTQINLFCVSTRQFSYRLKEKPKTFI